jgi:UDP-2,3-diacylglucosamine pyrophosphatase LpxH
MVILRIREVPKPAYRHLRFVPAVAALLAFLAVAAGQQPAGFRFVILGDRTGETVPGVFAQTLREATARNPAFLVGVGDTIQGLNDETSEAEWREAEDLLAPYRRYRLYLAPGNHDIWSERSAALFQKYTGHPTHYSFDYQEAHFTILDNSQSDQFSADELAFLEDDLRTHAAQPLKFIVSHRPGWILNVMIKDPDFPLQQLAKKYGVKYVIAGHLHALIHGEIEGVTYLSVPSSGGHLRAGGKYEDGSFFGYTVVEARAGEATFQFRELNSPYGKGRVTPLQEWGTSGLADAARKTAR